MTSVSAIHILNKEAIINKNEYLIADLFFQNVYDILRHFLE